MKTGKQTNTADGAARRRVVLVGTYRGGQLKDWPGWYCWPLEAGESHAKSAKTGRDAPTARPQATSELVANCDESPEWLPRVTELWLYRGTADERRYRTEFVGVKTREELIRDYGYPGGDVSATKNAKDAKGGSRLSRPPKPHGTHYALFKTELLYRHKNAPQEEADAVIVRLTDFARSPKVRKQLREYLESPDRNNPDIAKLLPSVVTSVPPERLRVCEGAVQLDLFASMPVAAPKDAIRVIELFAGVGGFRIGLERASKRFKTVWSNQWEPSTQRQDASAIYQRRFGMEGHSNEDIAKVPVSEIPEADLLVGGFPCQDYSVANTLKRSGGIAGKKGVLWWQIHRIVRDSRNPPKCLFLENVDRLLKSPASQRGRDFAIILASLADLGYCAEWRVINAADYGMPQRRRRTYIVAYREGTELANEASSSANTNPAKWILRDGVIARAFSSRAKEGEAISDFHIEGTLPEITQNFNKAHPGTSPFADSGFMVSRHVWTLPTVPEYEGHRTTLGELLVDESEVPESFFIDDKSLEEWKYLKGPKSEMRKTPEGFEYRYTEGGMAFPDALDKPSRTIITGEGGTSPSRFKHVVLTPSGRFRRLVPVELERLNMFPDNHTEGASDGRRAFLMGNALVTGIVERIGKVLKERM